MPRSFCVPTSLNTAHLQVVCQQDQEEEPGELTEVRNRSKTLRFVESKLSFEFAQNICLGNIQVVSTTLVSSDQESGRKSRPLQQRKRATAVQTLVV